MWRQSAADVAAELDKKLHDKEWLAQAGKSARLLAEEHFDRDVLADQLIQVLQAAADGKAELAAQTAPGEYRF